MGPYKDIIQSEISCQFKTSHSITKVDENGNFLVSKVSNFMLILILTKNSRFV